MLQMVPMAPERASEEVDPSAGQKIINPLLMTSMMLKVIKITELVTKMSALVADITEIVKVIRISTREIPL